MVKDNPDYLSIVPPTATLYAGGLDAAIPAGWEGALDDDPLSEEAGGGVGGGGGDGANGGGSGEDAANAQTQEAGAMPAGMARMIATRVNQNSGGGGGGGGRGGEGGAGGGGDEVSEARRKPAVVAALTAPSFKGEPVTDFGDDFYEAEVEGI